MTGLYFCPAAVEVESASHGGFDVCCDRPDLHVPLPDGPATDAMSEVLSEAVKSTFAARERERAVRALHRPVTLLGQTCCDECSIQRSTGPRTAERIAYIPHPCQTVRTLDGEAS